MNLKSISVHVFLSIAVTVTMVTGLTYFIIKIFTWMDFEFGSNFHRKQFTWSRECASVQTFLIQMYSSSYQLTVLLQAYGTFSYFVVVEKFC